MPTSAQDGTEPYARRKPREFVERLLRVIRSADDGVQSQAMAEFETLLFEFNGMQGAARIALDDVIADETIDRVDRFTAAWLNFSFFGDMTPDGNALFEASLSGKDHELWVKFIALCCTTGVAPPVVTQRLDSFLSTDDEVVQLIAACILERPESISILVQALNTSTEPSFRRLAAGALCRMDIASSWHKRKAAEQLARLLDHDEDDWDFQASIAFALGRLGPYAEGVLPALTKALDDHESPLEYKRIVVDAILHIGKQAADRRAVARALTRALDLGDASLAMLAAAGLVELGLAPKRAVEALVAFLDHEDPRMRGAAVSNLGLLKHAAEAAVLPLISLWDREDDNDVLKSIIRALAAIGRAAIAPLMARLASGHIKKADLPLATFGLMDDVPMDELMRMMLLGRDVDMSLSIAIIMRMFGVRMDSGISTIRTALKEGDPRQQFNAVVALSGSRQDVLEAAPELVDILAQSQDPTLLHWTARVLKSMGAAVAPEVKRALWESSGFGWEVSGLGKKLLLDLNSRFELEQAGKSPTPDWSWYKKDDHLRIFQLAGEILKQQGPTSYKILSNKIEAMIDQRRIHGSLPTSPRNIGLVIDRLERELTAREGRDVSLTSRDGNRRGGLTVDGLKYLAEITAYLKSLI